ncbi:multiphosphoryl transfer protein 1 [includes phosphoenolpyruvate-protein phosphotransferase;phosphocarrier protein Hp; fructose-like phosphotransferase enzyme IIA component] [Escherichia coli]|uniref:Multiphosphoryl transfer protein 1 [includes phosphoenolpyruvate-protein phosphotransferasephosphocarrier protein Hp fructose-like phosphotransferase enzyme IIA component] n=1 Tax=Escherichia coli TaxID=562 RepID=A0A376SCL7_ECOLX|nr:multiphosphoryl transfer protein 1 [includes phosphoenolpyruvate-protein phosphotransferase;phosphocarrier protein Hp; fructose-like phosphotransferase enzyme IIA component] [Escherichia coli]
MSSPRIPAVKSQLRQLDSEACRELARQACECRSAQEIEALLTAFTPEEDVRPLLALENIFVDQSFSNKEQAIQFLCGNLGVNGRTEHPFELEEDVWQREEIVTTGVGFGVAIPHTKSQWIRHSSISIARLAKPVDWQSEMGEVELVIMLTLGANEGMNHVKVFSQLARKLVNKNFRPVAVRRARCAKHPDAAGNGINLLKLALKAGRCTLPASDQTDAGRRDKNNRYPENRNAAPLHESTDDISAKSSSPSPFAPSEHTR